VPDKLNQEERDELAMIFKESSEDLEDKTRTLYLYALRKTSRSLRLKIEDYVKKKEMIEIDAVVTSDTHRLIRVPLSLHGKTGLAKVMVANLAAFDPFMDAVALSNKEMTLHQILLIFWGQLC